MKKWFSMLLAALLVLGGCESASKETQAETEEYDSEVVHISLSDDEISYTYGEEKDVTDGEKVREATGIYEANDIVYYPTGKDFMFGEGEAEDEHEASEAEAHTVVHITKAGTYRLTGSLSAGQVAVDLGEDAEEDPEAVVTLILDNVDITCTVAPAVIFYNVYECGDTENGTAEVDTSAAGANVLIADGSENNIAGSYVARIYKDGTQELSEDGTEVLDAKKLHKYDAAFYSKMSMNVSGDTGVLNIKAENEGLDSELHLTIHGGTINITAGNDGINTNEDGISVTTVNGGHLNIVCDGATGEGDGIDSNGWLVINGGTVTASGCGISGDAGIDSDMGIYINGGTVIAGGNMLDHIAGGDQTYAVFQFAERQQGGNTYALKNEAGEVAMECAPENDFTYLILAGDALEPGVYTFWQGETQLAAGSGNMMGGRPGGMMGGQMPEGFDPEKMELPEGMEMPEGMAPGKMEMPEGMEPGERPEMPEGMEMPEDMEIPEGMEMPEGGFGGGRPGGFGGQMGGFSGELSKDFEIKEGGNQFAGVTIAE